MAIEPNDTEEKYLFICEDDNYVIRYWDNPSEWAVGLNYEVFDVEYFEDNEKYKPHYWIKDATSNMETTEKCDEAEVMISGNIKWDGCSNNDFSPAIHGCGKKDMIRFGAIFAKLFSIAEERTGLDLG